MPDHCTSLRQHNEQQRPPAATRSLADHPGLSPLAKSLALDPALVRRLCAQSLLPAGFRQHCAVVVPFMPGFAPPKAATSGAREAAGAEPGTCPGFPAGNNGAPPNLATVDQVAREYLALSDRPPGTIRHLATARGVDFHQLLRAIGELHQRFG